MPPAQTRIAPHAAVASALLPGLGHVVLGMPRRGVLIFLGVFGLYTGGLLIGGIDAIDRREHPLWFFGQALVGPTTFVVNHLNQNHFKVNDQGQVRTANPDEGRDDDGFPRALAEGEAPPNIKGVGRVSELGLLLPTLAGMLAVLVFLDALLPRVDAEDLLQSTGDKAGGAKKDADS
ncbi:MAG: DUF6677 family protein [Planctomycetota bacterium]